MKTSAAMILLGLLVGCRAPAPEVKPPAASAASTSATTTPSPVTAEQTPAEQAPAEQTPETVWETTSLTGEFVGFEAGDYLHAIIRKPDGERESFFLEPGMEIFLVDHQNQPLELVYQTVDTELPEAGGVTTIERLSSISVGGETFANWWQTAEPNFGKLLGEYQPRIEKATLGSDEISAGEGENPQV